MNNDFNIDLSWLQNLPESKNPLVFIGFGLIGLYTSVAYVIQDEKRMPNRHDFIKLFAFVPFVAGFSLYVGTSPLISLFIGVVPGTIFQIIKKRAEKYFEDKEKDDDEDARKLIDEAKELLEKDNNLHGKQ